MAKTRAAPGTGVLLKRPLVDPRPLSDRGDLKRPRRSSRAQSDAFYERFVGQSAGVNDEELRALAAEWAERTALEQGLPPRVADHDVLRQIARLLELDASRLQEKRFE